eukprot:scaffold22879_cov92-Isochrysis_galbana.AAC.5
MMLGRWRRHRLSWHCQRRRPGPRGGRRHWRRSWALAVFGSAPPSASAEAEAIAIAVASPPSEAAAAAVAAAVAATLALALATT